MPTHIVDRLREIRNAERTLLESLGREATAAELGREVGVPRDEVDRILRFAQPPVSLDKPIGEDGDASFGDLIGDLSVTAPDEAAETTLQNEHLRGVVAALPTRERRIIELRYGLDGREPRTLGEIGRTLNLSRERIRQIEEQTLQDLWALARPELLDDVS